jgi:acyl dehydratase
MVRRHADPDTAFWGWCDVWLDPEFRSWSLEPELDLLSAQEQVDCFADLTGDHNFLHVDVVAECLVRFYA